MRPETTQKYFTTDRCEGEARPPSSGSLTGRSPAIGSGSREAYHHAIKPMPASSMITLTPVHTTASPVGRLPMSASCGQLLV